MLIHKLQRNLQPVISPSPPYQVNLMAHFKLSTSRDFRINNHLLTEAIQSEEEDQDEEKGNSDADGNDAHGGKDVGKLASSGAHAKKRPRLEK